MRWWAVAAGWSRRVLFGCFVGGLAACGGGGDGGDAKSPVTATFEPPVLSVTAIEGLPATAAFRATVDSGGRDSLYIGIEELQGLVVDGDLSIQPPSIDVTIQLSSALAPGVYNSTVRVLACADAECKQQQPGSPMQLPLRYTVTEQIKIQTPATLRRTGREPAPTLKTPVVLPPQAGEISVELIGGYAFVSAALQGNQLVVQTRQVPAGVHTAQVRLTGGADSRYRATADLRYEVLPPPEGERPLRATPYRFDVRQAQGTQSTHRFKVEGPTWTDAPVEVTMSPSTLNVVRDLRPLGNDEYEFTVDTRNVPVVSPTGGSIYFGGFVADAGELAGRISVDVAVHVGQPLSFSDTSTFQMVATATTSSADLLRRTAVTAADGSAARWTASADQPWVELVRSAGTTGVDALEFRFNPSVLLLEGLVQYATLTVALDRPDTLPVEVLVSVTNFVPSFEMASPGVLTGSSAKVYVHGRVFRETDVLRPGVLSVEGATLQSAAVEEDTRFVGSVGLLALTLSDIVPGRPVTIRSASALRPAAVTLPSTGPVRVPSGYAVLPYAQYRPPSFASSGGALVFASPDTVWRWPQGAGGWQTPSSQQVPGAIDAALMPDESQVLVTTYLAALALDPTTLQTRRESGVPSAAGRYFDSRTAGFNSTLAFAADGRAFASVLPSDAFSADKFTAVSWLAGCAPMFAADPTRSLCFPDPSNPWFPNDPGSSPPGASIARSQEGTTLMFSHPGGRLYAYRGIARQREDLGLMAQGRRVVAVDNSGTVKVQDDGSLDNGVSVSSLPARLPAGFVAGGYAVRGDGDLVAVYAYRIVNEPAGPRARDARLILFGTPGRSGAGLSGQVDLPDAVGCTAPLVAGETCGHTAALQFAPGGQSLFLLGPRGVAAVPVPTLSASAAPASRSPFRTIAPTKQPAAR